jgi:hypothetical protein
MREESGVGGGESGFIRLSPIPNSPMTLSLPLVEKTKAMLQLSNTLDQLTTDPLKFLELPGVSLI